MHSSVCRWTQTGRAVGGRWSGDLQEQGVCLHASILILFQDSLLNLPPVAWFMPGSVCGWLQTSMGGGQLGTGDLRGHWYVRCFHLQCFRSHFASWQAFNQLLRASPRGLRDTQPCPSSGPCPAHWCMTMSTSTCGCRRSPPPREFFVFSRWWTRRAPARSHGWMRTSSHAVAGTCPRSSSTSSLATGRGTGLRLG